MMNKLLSISVIKGSLTSLQTSFYFGYCSDMFRNMLKLKYRLGKLLIKASPLTLSLLAIKNVVEIYSKWRFSSQYLSSDVNLKPSVSILTSHKNKKRKRHFLNHFHCRNLSFSVSVAVQNPTKSSKTTNTISETQKFRCSRRKLQPEQTNRAFCLLQI